MKRFTLLLAILIATAAFILRYTFNYDLKTVIYHLLMVTTVCLLQFAGNIAITAIPHPRIKAIVFHLYNFTFLLALVLFYVLILSSNGFWEKTITLNIIKNYFFSINDLIKVIPVERWLLLAFPIVLILLTILIYFTFKPSIRRAEEVLNWLRRYSALQIGMVVLFVLSLLFVGKAYILNLKREMHFAEEPILIFFLGPMWQGNGEELAFDRVRFENGKKDQACMAAIKKHDYDPAHNFVIILIDALRSDHLSCYGYSRKTTPFLDSLYATGHLSLVPNAFSPSNNTIGGVAGLFYSKEWDKFGYNGLNIFKFLKKVGYKNYAFLTGFHKEWYGLSALYRSDCDYYYESSMNFNKNLRIDDDLITLEEFKKAKFSGNSFIYLHLLSAHHVGKKYDQFKKFLPDKIGLDADRREALINNYDNGILQSDYVIKAVMEKLEQEKMLANTTLFIVADHGELFGEDNSWSHGGNIHEKLLEVPLLVYDQQQPTIKTTAGSLLDVAPTIADLLHYPIPDCWQGYSLLNHPKNFSLNVLSSDEHADYPYGKLSCTDSICTLQVFDHNHNLHKTVRKEGNSWKRIIP